MPPDLGAVRPLGWSEPGRTTEEIRTGSWRVRRPVYVEATAPCRAACPAGEPVARWIERLRLGDYAGAWALVREENPFPAITGRVCAHPCETACNRGGLDAAVAINALEQAVGDWGCRHGTAARTPRAREERVAIVGGGPAGLTCAYHLARLGYRVTVFEAQRELGGLLRHGIPEYRLPRQVLDREVELALGAGVEVRTGWRLGADLPWERLTTYDGAFLATGAELPRGPGVPGERSRGVRDALGFLREVNAGAARALARRAVVVVGGGSTAIDAARCARRLGAARVTVLALESREAMPAIPDEVAQALAEAVEIRNGVGVTEFLAPDDALRRVAIRAATLERAADGAIRPVFRPGLAELLDADLALLAIGQETDRASIPPGIVTTAGIVVVDAAGSTSVDRLYAGGDVASRARTVSHAIGAGTRAARAIHARLSGVPAGPTELAPGWATATPGRVVTPAEVDRAAFSRSRRAERRLLSEGDRACAFVEVVEGLDERAARAEAQRCFTCGACVGCDVCFHVCPDVAIHRADGGYAVALEHCKGCGLCARECPRGALSMEAER